MILRASKLKAGRIFPARRRQGFSVEVIDLNTLWSVAYVIPVCVSIFVLRAPALTQLHM
jgi:hypothetical protein